MNKKIPPAPAGSCTNGKKLWKSVLGDYELRGDEVEVLRQLVAEITIIESLEKAYGADPRPLVAGSHGGTIANPLLSEIRQHRSTALALWKSLKLPELEDSVSDRSPKSLSRLGNEARWGRRYG